MTKLSSFYCVTTENNVFTLFLKSISFKENETLFGYKFGLNTNNKLFRLLLMNQRFLILFVKLDIGFA